MSVPPWTEQRRAAVVAAIQSAGRIDQADLVGRLLDGHLFPTEISVTEAARLAADRGEITRTVQRHGRHGRSFNYGNANA